MKERILKIALFFIAIILVTGCVSYHDLSLAYQQQLQNGYYTKALEQLNKNKFLKKNRNKLLYYLEKGKLAYLAKDYKLSNEFFNKADDLIELDKKNINKQILGVLTNPEKENYKAEDFEKVAIHYYKSLNYIFLNQYDDALVEAKRINLELQKINDKYPEGKKNRYTSDAFALNLQGMLYEALGNVNDAFISYRNAIELYQKNDGNYFGVSIPNQLKQDVVNTAHVLGFYDEEKKFGDLFDKKFDRKYIDHKNVIVFWENGLIPYKSQTYFTFTALPGSNHGIVTFTNEELGLSLAVPTRNKSSDNKFSDLNVLNISFPKYESRNAYYTKAVITLDEGISYELELIEDYNTIAKQSLKDRTVREIGKIVMRVAAKKIAEGVVANQNQNLGALVGLFNAFTEKSDTRNWQTLPNKIYYSRVVLKDGSNTLKIKATNKDGNTKEEEIKIASKLNLNFINYISPQINSLN